MKKGEKAMKDKKENVSKNRGVIRSRFLCEGV